MTLLPSKDNMSLDIDEISNSNLLKTTSEVFQPTQTLYACAFDI